MAISWTKLRRTDDPFPPIVVVYGGEGEGKTSFAGDWPNPLYVQTGKRERPAAGYGDKLLTWGLTETYEEFNEQINFMLEAEHDRLTFVVDTLDCLETIVMDEACRRQGWQNITEGKFAEPKNATADVWREVIDRLVDLKAAGFAVILIAHVKTKTEPGVTTDSYPRYRLNMRHDDDAASVAHAADIIGFIHQRVSVQKEAGGFHKDNVKKRGEGSGDRLIAVENRPGFIAKNKYGLKGTLPLKPGQGFEIFKEHIVVPYGNQSAGVVEQEEEEAA